MKPTFVSQIAQASYNTNTYGSGAYSQQSTTNTTEQTTTSTTGQTTSVPAKNNSTLASTGVPIVAPVLGGVFLLATASAIVALKIRRAKQKS